MEVHSWTNGVVWSWCFGGFDCVGVSHKSLPRSWEEQAISNQTMENRRKFDLFLNTNTTRKDPTSLLQGLKVFFSVLCCKKPSFTSR